MLDLAFEAMSRISPLQGNLGSIGTAATDALVPFSFVVIEACEEVILTNCFLRFIA